VISVCRTVRIFPSLNEIPTPLKIFISNFSPHRILEMNGASPNQSSEPIHIGSHLTLSHSTLSHSALSYSTLDPGISEVLEVHKLIVATFRDIQTTQWSHVISRWWAVGCLCPHSAIDTHGGEQEHSGAFPLIRRMVKVRGMPLKGAEARIVASQALQIARLSIVRPLTEK
jgi:hypothetical protein